MKSTMTVARALNAAFDRKMSSDPSVFLLGEDIGVYGGNFGVTSGLLQKYGSSRVMDAPISENGFTGIAAGAAMMGQRPVVELIFGDFITLALDQLVNQAAKIRYLSNGALGVPMVLRVPAGCGTGAGAQHSQCLEAWVCHIPGLKVVAPSDAQTAYSLMLAAIDDPDPVVFFESKKLYKVAGEVDTDIPPETFLNARVVREGTDVSLITYSRMTGVCLEAAKELEKSGISAEVLDLLSLSPLDEAAILRTVGKTRRAVIVHEAPLSFGIGGEIAALIARNCLFNQLKAPVVRVCGADAPIPFCRTLEALAVPDAGRVTQAVQKLFTGEANV